MQNQEVEDGQILEGFDWLKSKNTWKMILHNEMRSQ